MSKWFRTYGFADVLDNLVIGPYPLDAEDVEMLQRAGVTRVLNLCEDAEYRPGEREAVEQAYADAGIPEQRLHLTDYAGLTPEDLENAVRLLGESLDEHGRTYLHCRAGWQRSPAVAAGAIAVRNGIDVDSALAQIRQRKPSADPLPHQRADLEQWWAQRGRRGE